MRYGPKMLSPDIFGGKDCTTKLFPSVGQSFSDLQRDRFADGHFSRSRRSNGKMLYFEDAVARSGLRLFPLRFVSAFFRYCLFEEGEAIPAPWWYLLKAFPSLGFCCFLRRFSRVAKHGNSASSRAFSAGLGNRFFPAIFFWRANPFF